jgi:hypothetical protein
MTQYLLSVFIADDDFENPPDDMEQIYQDVDVLNTEMMDKGAWVFGGGLHPADTATTVRADNGRTLITDGPYVETKEYLGGFWIIEAPDMDSALEWAGKATVACRGPIEVRPFQDEPEV